MKFIFETQTSRTQVYHGRSGKNYTINKGMPFEVEDKIDIDFFESKNQFRKAKGKDNKSEPVEDVDTKLLKMLLKISGVSKKTAEKLVEIYVSEDKLIQAIEGGGKLAVEIPEKQAALIIEKLIKRGA